MQLRNKINAMEFCEITIPSDITDHLAISRKRSTLPKGN